MKRLNLIPAQLIDARRRRDHARWCVKACGLYALLALLAAVGCRLAWSDDKQADAQYLAAADADVERINASISAARADLNAAKVSLAINRQLTSQPDWSLLLKLLAGQNNDAIVLKSCAINTRAEPPTAPAAQLIQISSSSDKSTRPAATPPRLAVLTVGGTAASQLAIAEYVVRLEKTGLFSRVNVVDISHARFFASEALAFRLECILNEGEK